jgi:D-alanyl-D-alanine carboxypeptidase
VALLAATAAPAAAAATEHGTRDRPALQSALDDLVASGGVGAVAEVRDGHRVWKGHSGVAQLETHRAVPADSRFRIGSVTKTFVATVVLQLVEHGRLHLGDTVESWLPGVVPSGDQITIRHLLNHTSGLFDYLHTLVFPPSPEFLTYRSRTWTPDELVERAVSNPPVFDTPGMAFDYSDTNYILLGMIIEKATGTSYAHAIETQIIRPLHLRGTSVPGTSEEIPGPHLHGYVPIADSSGYALVDYTESNPSVMGAAGGMISTTSDLNRFLAALFGGQLISRDLLLEMTDPGTEHGRYGLGLFIVQTACGIPVYGHDGDALSYNAWTYSTKDGSRQIAIGLTPSFHGDTDDAVDALVDKAFCGSHEHSKRAGSEQ